MTEEEMRRYRYLRKEIAVERERMAKMAGDERAKRIAEIIAEKIERAETEAERIERYIADVEEPVVRMLMVERYIHLQDIRVARLRAFYNRELAEKDRWIRFLLILCLLLVSLLLVFCVIIESPL